MGKTKKPQPDHLTLCAAAARAEGLSYGQWKAKHPEGLPGDFKIDPPKVELGPKWHTKVCEFCGREFHTTNGQKVNCSPSCRRKKYEHSRYIRGKEARQ